jgi:hypothetical protein
MKPIVGMHMAADLLMIFKLMGQVQKHSKDCGAAGTVSCDRQMQRTRAFSLYRIGCQLTCQ